MLRSGRKVNSVYATTPGKAMGQTKCSWIGSVTLVNNVLPHLLLAGLEFKVQ
jgi:hypothetical protein